jgi:dipeptide/tripeptide permease
MTKTQSTKVVGLGFAMVLLALGTGGVKATASPFIGNSPIYSFQRLLQMVAALLLDELLI